MIIVHKMNGDEFVLNSFHIEKIESTPDTVITLTNEKKFIVTERPEQIIDKIIEFQNKIKLSSGMA